MPVIILERPDEQYLQKCVEELEEQKVVFGIIIGQNIKGEEYIVAHLAKNQEEDIDINWTENKNNVTDAGNEDLSPILDSFANINTQSLANQWLQAIRMTPGSFTVLGIFAGAKPEDILENSTIELTMKILKEVRNFLLRSESFETYEDEPDYIFLSYSLDVQRADCKLYSLTDESNVVSIGCHISEEPFQWYVFTTFYELNEVFPIRQTENQINIEEQFRESLKAVRKFLELSEIQIQNKGANDDLTTIESYINNTVVNKNVRLKPDLKDLQASIYLPIEWQAHDYANHIKVRPFSGSIKFFGEISSRIYCSPRNTLQDAKRYIRCDVIRSLVARIQVYCDGSTEKNISRETILISHPPRRIYFNISCIEKISPIYFSEYIFRNETIALVITQVQQILDLDLKPEDIDDLEGESMDELESGYSAPISHSQITHVSEDANESYNLTRSMYTLGIVVALLVLLSSVCLNIILQL